MRPPRLRLTRLSALFATAVCATALSAQLFPVANAQSVPTLEDQPAVPISLSAANEMRQTFGLRPISALELAGADLRHSSVGVPLVGEELKKWDDYQSDIAQLRAVRDGLRADVANFGWMRIASNDISRPVVEIGQVVKGGDRSRIPKGWRVAEKVAEQSEAELNKLIESIGSPDETKNVGARASKGKAKIQSAISKGAKVTSVSIDYAEAGPKLHVTLDSIPNGFQGDDNVVVEQGSTPDFTDRNSTVGQFKGGTHIGTPVGGCTSNINVLVGAARFALTAGHCFDNNLGGPTYGSEPSWVANGSAVTHDGRRIGTFVQSSARKTTVADSGSQWIMDVALVKLDATVSSTNLFMWRQPGATVANQNNYYDNVLQGYGNPLTGEFICMEGASAYRNNAASGYMQSVCGAQGGEVSIFEGPVAAPVFVGKQFSLNPWGGVWGNEICRQDSGAIVRVPSGQAARPQGIVSGMATGGIGSSRLNASGDTVCSPRVRWTPIWLILSSQGLGVQYYRGASNLRNTRTGECFDGNFEGVCNAAIEYVPASSPTEADTTLLYNFGLCSESGLSSFNGYNVLSLINGCNYGANQQFEFINAGSGRFRLRNVGANAFAQAVGDGRVGMVSSGGDIYELTGS